MCQQSVALVGLGLHAKRIYLHFLQHHKVPPALVVDLDSNAREIMSYLSQRKIQPRTLFIPFKERGRAALSPKTTQALRGEIQSLRIKKAIIATEPKAHMAYAKFFLGHGVDVLMDKPLSAPLNTGTDEGAGKQILSDHRLLQQILKKHPRRRLVIQSQRRWHPGYLLVKRLVTETIKKYHVPITSIDIYHSDGLWSMPPEFRERENHPYKYGYGKLLHSGYHFVDLFVWLTNSNDILKHKRPGSIDVYHLINDPENFLFQVQKTEYEKFFSKEAFNSFFATFNAGEYQGYGEVDSHSLIRLLRGHHTVTIGSLTLLQNGFSRRSWPRLPEDTYKKNGRVRHERVTIQLGPLLNLQVHSYESYEAHERSRRFAKEQRVGGLEHFDIYIFRNTGIMGGKPFEHLAGGSLIPRAGQGYLGHNEEARRRCITEFLSGKVSNKDFEEQYRTTLALSLLHRATALGRQGKLPYLHNPYRRAH